MDNNNTINDVLDFFVKKENAHAIKSNDTNFLSKFSTLKTILNDSAENEFAKNTIISNIYSNIKSESLQIGSFIESNSFVSFLKNYNNFSQQYLTKHVSELNKIKKEFEAIINLDEYKNWDEIIAYVITQSIIEYSQANIVFIPSNQELTTYSNKFNESIGKVKFHSQVLSELKGKEYGFYLFNAPYNKTIGNAFKHGGGFILASLQSNGITIVDFHSKVIGRQGLSGNSINTNHIANKNHEIKLISKNKSTDQGTDLSILNNISDFQALPFINKLIIISVINILSSSEKRKDNETDSKFLISTHSNETEHSTLPMLRDLPTTAIQDVTFDDLRFTGKYDFLAPLDDLYQDILNMDVVNYKSDDVDCFFDIKTNFKKNDCDLGDYFKKVVKPNSFSKEEFNAYTISHSPYAKGYLGIERDGLLINPLRSNNIGTVEELRKGQLQLAKMNKLTLYTYYNIHYFDLFYDDFKRSMQTFLIKNMDALLVDSEFLSLIDGVAVTKNQKHTIPIIDLFENVVATKTVKKALTLSNIQYLHEDTKIKYLLNLSLSKTEIFELFSQKYGLSLPKELQYFVTFYDISLKLEKIRAKTLNNSGIKANFFTVTDLETDFEIYRWFNNIPLLSATLLLGNKDKKTIINRFNELGTSITEIEKGNYFKF